MESRKKNIATGPPPMQLSPSRSYSPFRYVVASIRFGVKQILMIQL